MGVRVRLFAALREAAGAGEVELAAGPLPALLGELRERHGERFAAVLAVSSVLIDGTSTPRDAGIEVADGAELALLPPVSGGAGAAGAAFVGVVVRRWPEVFPVGLVKPPGAA